MPDHCSERCYKNSKLCCIVAISPGNSGSKQSPGAGLAPVSTSLTTSTTTKLHGTASSQQVLALRRRTIAFSPLIKRMAEKKLKEAEKSPLTISFNLKEENLLKKKILSLDVMKKQAADSRSLDQKLLYNHFTLKLRRSELAYARLIGNTDLMKHLAHTTFSSFNTTVNDDTEKAVRAILQNGKLPRAVSAPCRPNSRMSESGKIYGTDATYGHNIRKRNPNTPQRFYSAPTRRKSVNQRAQVTFFEESESIGFGKQKTNVKEFLRAKAERPESDMKFSQGNESLVKRRPKSTSFLLNNGRTRLQGSSTTMEDITEKTFSTKVKTFIEKVKSLQHNDPTLKDYYSQRLLDGTGKKEISDLTYKDDEKEQSQWLPTGEEHHYRSVTMKKLNTNFTRKDVPTDILFMEQYNLVLTKENCTVRNWVNNDPYISAK